MKTTQELYREREKRFNDAVSLSTPDRVPIVSVAGFFMTRYSGISNKDAMYDYQKMSDAWYASMMRLNWDMSPPSFTIMPGPVMEILDLKQFKWPGYNLDNHLSFQYVEREYMMADEYDEFLREPGDFTIRRIIPRISGSLSQLNALPPLHWLIDGYSLLFLGSTLAGLSPFAQAMDTLLRAGREMNEYNSVHAKLTDRLKEAGYPVMAASTSITPFDLISSMLRGLEGTIRDMYSNPDKLLAAIDTLIPFVTESAILAARISGNPRIFIPLHRGGGGFMSKKHFSRFYWPGVEKMLTAFIKEGFTPLPFFEGDYTPNLEFLAQLPKGKIAGHFDVVDIQKAKEIVGDTMCFWGNVPASILVTGTPQETQDYVKMLIDTFADKGGLIIDGAAEGVPAESKPENVEAMTKTVFEYGEYN